MRDRIPTSLYSAAAVAVSLTGMFLLVGIGSPGPDGAADVPVAPLMEPENRPAASGDGTAEGIKVHGHWTIEVREPDGRLVTRREFENALMSSGRNLLMDLLTRRRSTGSWQVVIGGLAAETPCLIAAGQPSACYLGESEDAVQGPNYFPGLAVEVEDDVRFVLSGTLAAQRNARISIVETRIGSCHPSVSSLDCSIEGDVVFTRTTIPAISVLEGQSIHVAVSISFVSDS